MRAITGTVVFLLTAALVLPSALAGEHIEREGETVRTEVSGMWNFFDVVEVLRAELFNRGWRLQDVQDVDFTLRDQGMLLHNKVVTVTHPARVAKLINDSQKASLLVTQQIAVYQKAPRIPWSYRAKPGPIVLLAIDPAVKAKALGMAGTDQVAAMRKEIDAALAATARFFSEPAE